MLCYMRAIPTFIIEEFSHGSKQKPLTVMERLTAMQLSLGLHVLLLQYH